MVATALPVSPAPRRRPRPALLAGQCGSTALETALVLPTFFLLVFGLFYFSIVLFGFCNATFASRAAARYACLHSSTSLAPATTASVQAVASPYLPGAPLATTTVLPTWSPSNTVGGTVTVSITLVYSVGIPFTTLRSITVGSTAQRTILR
jgi:Flp pilus assembly protein TadG